MNRKNYYKCFSSNLKEFIGVHNINPISSGVHPQTKKTYHVYEMSEKLEQLLTTWSDLAR